MSELADRVLGQALMAHRFPPFAAMRAFEAAARLSSFKRAAEELSLTPSAISHQVKALEGHLGVRLFARTEHGLVLTDTGNAYLAGLQRAFDHLVAATSQVTERETAGTLSISVIPSFAARWLIPRLRRFYDLHPELRVSLTSLEKPSIHLETPWDFHSTGIDAEIRYGQGRWEGMAADYLLAEEIFPICSPAYLAKSPPLRGPADLVHHTIIDYEPIPDEWRTWLVAANAADLVLEQRMRLDQRSFVQQVVLEGFGIAMGRRPFINDDLAAGKLVAPFDITLQNGNGYHLICPKSITKLAKIVAFREWLVDEASKSDSQAARPTQP